VLRTQETRYSCAGEDDKSRVKACGNPCAQSTPAQFKSPPTALSMATVPARFAAAPTGMTSIAVYHIKHVFMTIAAAI